MINNYKLKNFLFDLIFLEIGDWGLGIGDWGVGAMPQTPNPKAQTPDPNFF